MRKQAGFWRFVFVVVLLALTTVLWCQSASAAAVNCSDGPGLSCVADNSSDLHDLASTSASFRALGHQSSMTGDTEMILPGPQLFKRQSGDVTSQTQLSETQPLPEPSTIVLLSMGLIGIAISIRRIH